MVFGWGKRRQREEPAEETVQNQEITLEAIPKILDDFTTLRKKQTLSEIVCLRNDTEPLIEDLIKIGNVLERDSLNTDDIDRHLATIVIRGKKQVIGVIKKDVVSLPKISSLDDAEKLNSVLNLILKKLGDVLGRQTRVIHIFAKKYAAQLKNNLEVMNGNHSEIRKLLKNFDSTKTLSGEILDLLASIGASGDSRAEKSRKIDNVKNTLLSLTEKISVLQKSISDAKSSENYTRYLALKKTLDEFVPLKAEIRNQINAQFTKISRPLSRYEYASSLDKDQKNILTRLVADPFDVMTEKDRDSVIVILENIRKGITSGSISVKDVEKTSAQITEIVESLDGFVKTVSDYHTRHTKLSGDVDSLLPSDLLLLESQLEKNTVLRNDSNLRYEALQEEIGEIDSNVPLLISEMEEKLRRFSSTRYVILRSQN